MDDAQRKAEEYAKAESFLVNDQGEDNWHELRDAFLAGFEAGQKELEAAKLEAYQRGRGDEREMLAQGEPDVWVPYHPEFLWQFNAYASTKVVAEMALTKALENNGWQIVPVKLVKMEVKE